MDRFQKPLAVLGGSPAFPEKLHVGRPNIGDRQALQRRFDQILDTRLFTNGGPLVNEFEERIASYLGVKHCIATCNGTNALMLAVRGLEMKGEVILPSFTFIATAHALQWQETRPVFCDVDPLTHNLDPQKVEACITPQTTGIIGVHLWGRPCDTAALEAIAQKHGLKLLFDASHAFGSTSLGQRIGRFGDAEVFSFHATKFVNCFEGGAIVTNNDRLAKKLRLMRNFGFVTFDTVVHLGMNAKMPEVCAAMGLTSLEALDDFIAINRRNHRIYTEALAQLPGITVCQYPEGEEANYQYVILEIDPARSPLTRDELHRVLTAENVLARRYFYPGCHRMEPYASSGLKYNLPVTERLSQQVLALPTGTSIGLREIETITSLFRQALTQAEEVRAALKAPDYAPV